MIPARPIERSAALRDALVAVGLALAWIVLVGAVFLADLDAPTRTALRAALDGGRLALLALLTAPALALLAYGAVRLRAPVERITGQVRLIAGSNPAHRIDAASLPLGALAAAINTLADQRSQALAELQGAAAQARAGIEQERDRIAALLGELDQSVLVCNREGRILLYNAAAVELLGSATGDGGTASPGLGRSVYSLLDRELLGHAIEAIEAPASRGERARAQFVASYGAGRLLRVGVAPVLAGRGGAGADGAAGEGLRGIVILLTDVTESIDIDRHSVQLFDELAAATRETVAGLRAGIDALAQSPGPDESARARIVQTARADAARLAGRLDRLGADVAARLRNRWPLEQMHAPDLLALAARRIPLPGGMPAARVDEADAALWLRVDSFTLIPAIVSLARRLHEEFGVRDVRLAARVDGARGRIDLAWKGVPMSSETAFSWQNDAFAPGGGDSPLSLSQVLQRHGGEAWYLRDAPSQTNFFRLALPLCERREPTGPMAYPGARPEFYDFDLFQAVDPQHPDHRALADLAYTAFDTETTGLDPDGGDQIVSIGAVRIVNRRVLRAETYATLVDPRRPIPLPATAVHGIDDAAVAGQPRIGQVLPRLARFAEDTVLLGHNVAFDMRLLQLQEQASGVRFRQPVLDTLLLAAVALPGEPSHSLDALATRLGVRVQGRHTALGDALATAEVFLALLPLLAQQGIVTLDHALEASKATWYARQGP